MTARSCRATSSGDELCLIGPAFEVHLDRAGALRPVRWINHLRDASVEMHAASELRAVIDEADRRIWIRGWRGETSVVGLRALDDDPGIHLGYPDPRFDDRAWRGMHSPSHFWYEQDERLRWVRTHVFLPPGVKDRPLELVLGGLGLFDFRWMRVYVNGAPIAIREATGRWREPGRFDLGPASGMAGHLRFGGDNVIALQLAGYLSRDERLDASDPGRGRLMPLRSQWPAQFEQHLVVGRPDRHLAFRAVDVKVRRQGPIGEITVEVESDEQRLRGEMTYRWSEDEPVLRRSLRLRAVDGPVDLLRLDLLAASAGWASVSDGEQGFPVHLDDTWYAGVEHPAGWAIGQAGHLELRQYPGRRVTAAEPFDAMATLVGSADHDGARASFVRHLARRMRRARRSHLMPMTLATAFGSWEYEPESTQGAFADVVSVEPTETIILDHIARVAEGRVDGLEVDTYVVDFWTDPAGDVSLPDRVRFPRGLGPIREATSSIGARLGLWLDSSMAEWTIGQNPVVSGSFTHDPGYGTERPSLCRAADPYRTLVRNGLLRLVTQEQVRTLKFDNLQSICHGAGHGHLPGIWSTEAIMSAQLEGLQAVDGVEPDTFLMLYWGHRSPWWLLDADTLFEPGFWIEASHPAGSPTLYVRDSVIQGLDQAQRYCLDVPVSGKDSLGVWLSSWKWNSSIGTERWAQAMVMDLCRGSLLVQPWSDRGWLTPPDRRLLADLIALLRGSPEAFAASRPIGGDPWRDEPYGYVCSDGGRAYVAFFNVTWRDTALSLELGPAWALPPGQEWRVVRRFPEPVVLLGDGPAPAGARIHLRPFEVVLLEILPFGEVPIARSRLPTRPWPDGFIEPSVGLVVAVDDDHGAIPSRTPLDDLRTKIGRTERGPAYDAVPPRSTHRLRTIVPPGRAGGTTVVWVRVTRDGLPLPLEDAGAHFAVTGDLDGEPIAITPVVRDRTYSVPWQAWRVEVASESGGRLLELRLTVALPEGARLEPGGTFVPAQLPGGN